MSTSIVIMAILFVAPLLVVVIFGISLLVRPPFNWLSSQENPINKVLTGRGVDRARRQKVVGLCMCVVPLIRIAEMIETIIRAS